MSGSPEKITIIGGGSARFAMELGADLLHQPELYGSELVLQDISPERIDIVRRMLDRLNLEVGHVDIRFSCTTDRQAAIKDAGFVINSALSGGRPAMERERTRQEELGIFRGIGLNTPFRQLKLMLDIGRDVAQFSPNAQLIQCANPVPEGGTLVHRDTGLEVIGVCEGFIEWQKIARLLGLNPELCKAVAIGINHNIWLTKFEHDGQDAYPILQEWIKTVAPSFLQYFMSKARNVDFQTAAVAFDLYEKYGLMPIGDTNRAIFPETWWYHTSNRIKEKWFGSTGGFDGEVGNKNNHDWLASMLTNAEQVLQDPKAQVKQHFMHNGQHGPWEVMPIIAAMSSSVLGEFQINIANKGAIAGLPDDFVVEVPATIDGAGIHRKETMTLPPKVMLGAVIPRWLLAERVLEAMKTGDIGFLWQTLMSDHKISSPEQAAAVLKNWLENDSDMTQFYSKNPLHPYLES